MVSWRPKRSADSEVTRGRCENASTRPGACCTGASTGPGTSCSGTGDAVGAEIASTRAGNGLAQASGDEGALDPLPAMGRSGARHAEPTDATVHVEGAESHRIGTVERRVVTKAGAPDGRGEPGDACFRQVEGFHAATGEGLGVRRAHLAHARIQYP